MARTLSVKIPTAKLVADVESSIAKIETAIAEYAEKRKQYEVEIKQYEKDIVASFSCWVIYFVILPLAYDICEWQGFSNRL